MTIEAGAVTNPHALLQRRTLNSLRFAQVPGQAAVAGMVAVVTLLASDLLGSDRLAGLGSASFTVGAALTSIPLAAFMRRRGRRRGLVGALLIGAVGSSIAAVGGEVRWFPLFLLGMVAFGAGQAATLQSRYAAADLAEPSRAGAAIAAIVWVGTLGAVFGPLLTPLEKSMAESVGLDELVGPFIVAAVLFAVAAVVLTVRLRPDPLEVLGTIDPDAERVRPLRQVRQSAGVIAASPNALLGLAAMAASQAAMVGVMTMTPPHMKDHDHADLSAVVIAVHIVGMYGLAPLVGRYVDRVGENRAIQVGAVVLGVGTVSTVAAGYVPALMFVGLFLLGLGWSIGLIAGSAILTTSVPVGTKVEVQGTADLTMSLCGAAAAFGSGFVKDSFGFHLLANGAAVLGAALLAFAWFTAARSGPRVHPT
ncbi:MFS transporter [Ilumatobacter nonamiensis]|uniref:MFS transporter n=1 Tax=Ilumatobacter nonamiensis TaxID=467093 RepID=UPI000348D9F7|nr:MFS transporter [Ilumatobacter nonamiensis]